MRILLVSMTLLAASSSLAFSQYQSEIPNGARLGNCSACHLSGGGSARNDFGNAHANEFTGGSFNWASVCGDDDDGDNQTNGQELGDPDCVWTGGAAARTTDISNPGLSSSTSNDPDGGSTGGAGGGEGEGEAAGGDGNADGGDAAGGCAGAAAGAPIALLALLRRRRR